MKGRAWLFVGAAGVSLALIGQLDALGPTAGATLTVASSILLALLAHGGLPLAGEAVALGAGGALAFEATRPIVPLVASGLLLTFIFGTRAMRSRTWRELFVHLGLAFGSGVAASWIARTHDGAELAIFSLAIVMAALVASIPWLLPTDAARAFALRRLAERARGPLRARLTRAVIAHAQLAELELPRRLARPIDRAFDELTRTAEHRLDRAPSTSTQPELSARVDQLVRVARASRARERLLEAIDADAGLGPCSDTLEAEVAALRELR
ncbi:MAG: hypothetical protein AB7S26_07660 [Sandaracinaceae bacterium]